MALTRTTKFLLAGLVTVLLLGGAGVTAAMLLRLDLTRAADKPPETSRTEPNSWEEGDNETTPPAVGTIHPKHDPSFFISVEELAIVEPYFRSDLRSRVSGQIKFMLKDYGERVSKGEVLAVIDVPDAVEAVGQKEALIAQRQREVELAQADLKVAAAAVDASRHAIGQTEASMRAAGKQRDFRRKVWERFQEAKRRDAATDLQVEEQEEAYLAAVEAADSAVVGVKKATADWEKAKASLEAAAADIRLKESLVDVAWKDRDQAQATADLAKIRAQWDGVITERPLDPGAFVTAQTDRIYSVERTDIVTVSMKVPDNFARFVDRNTEAVLRVERLALRGRVTRFSPSTENRDRTMHVEMDVYNGSANAYARYQLKCLATFLGPVAIVRPGAALGLAATGQSAWEQNRKGDIGSFPPLPKVSGRTDRNQPLGLIPGATGYMRLLLSNFGDAPLLPTGAVISRGGKKYIMEVKDGVAHVLPVEVQADDGKLAKVAVIVHEVDPKIGPHETLRNLSDDEEIVLSGQGDLADGQHVKAVAGEWSVQ